jgi:hypothetical protein
MNKMFQNPNRCSLVNSVKNLTNLETLAHRIQTLGKRPLASKERDTQRRVKAARKHREDAP